MSLMAYNYTKRELLNFEIENNVESKEFETEMLFSSFYFSRVVILVFIAGVMWNLTYEKLLTLQYHH